jgi:hypothetical protein
MQKNEKKWQPIDVYQDFMLHGCHNRIYGPLTMFRPGPPSAGRGFTRLRLPDMRLRAKLGINEAILFA